MRLKVFVLIVFLIFSTTKADEIVIKFNSEEEIKDFSPMQTRNKGISVWKIVEDKTAPSGNKAVQVFPDYKKNKGSTFNLLVYKKVKLKNLG